MSPRLQQVQGEKCRWVMPQADGMRVPGIIFATEEIIEDLGETKALDQVKNVAYLPGILVASMAMPDIHEGYGFPIGGVAATSLENGVIVPGGIGYDINCGVRLLLSDLVRQDVEKHIESLVEKMFEKIPTGVGREGPIRLSRKEMDEVLEKGAAWALERGYGWKEDLEYSEEHGGMKGADPGAVSDKAYKRGKAELGTLGSGNHFIEISYVETIYEPGVADAFGLFKDQVVFWVHSGSRGLGHQVCTDYLGVMREARAKYGISLPDRQLDSAPVSSPEGKRYFAAMAAAANYAWANRQVLSHYVRQAVGESLGKDPESLGMRLLYDVAHNIGKIEEHLVEGKRMKVMVHRKGATRAFGPGHRDVPERFRNVGQPVLIPGDMGRASYVLAGTEKAMEVSFGSACHGAGRALSRTQAKKTVSAEDLKRELSSRGVFVRSATAKGLVEEAPWAYKDVDEVVEATACAGLARKVARLRPMGVIKG
ncbi:MAG TPA: RtcB family protein [Firmicutes bacterium]|nr:RtcB family protein [Candidatus Fermentithermobacillaceae bacterium]